MSLLVFDFDGTLADTWRDIATALNRTLAEAGLPGAPAAGVRAWIGYGVVPLLTRAVPPQHASPEEIAVLYGRFRVHYDACCLDTTALYAGMAECLDRLDRHTLAVLSNKPAQFLDRIIAGVGLAGRFAAVVGGDSASAKKPDPAGLSELRERFRAQADETWMIGDSAIDIATGRNAGVHTIGCTWGWRPLDELRDAGAEYLVHAPGDIPPLIP